MTETEAEGKKPFSGHGQFLARSTALLIIATIISRLLGVVREIMVAKLYGASGQTDAFFFAYNIPELVRTLLISGALSSIFIPIFAEFAKKEGEDYAKKMSGQVFGFVFLLSLGITIIGIIIAPLIVNLAQLVGMGKVDKPIFDLTVELARLVFPILIFVALSGLCQGILNSLQNFKTPAYAPFFFNIVIIGILLTEDIISTEARIKVAAIAFVLGAVCQLAYQIPRLRREGVRIDLRINFRDPVYLRFLALAPAAMLGYGTMVVNTFVDKSIAYAYDEKHLSFLTYGFRVEQLPFSVFGVSVATALFPTISRYLTEGKFDEFKRATGAGVRILVFTVIPAMVVFLSLKNAVIKILFERGAFGPESTAGVADALVMYALGIVPASILLLIARVFFASKDMKTPLKAGVVMVVLNFILDIWFSQPWGLNMGFQGIALCTSIVAFINLGILVIILDGRHGGFIKMFMNRHVLKILIAGMLQYVAARLVYYLMISKVYDTLTAKAGFLEVLISSVTAITLSFLLYLFILFVLRAGELRMIREYLFTKRDKGNGSDQVP